MVGIAIIYFICLWIRQIFSWSKPDRAVSELPVPPRALTGNGALPVYGHTRFFRDKAGDVALDFDPQQLSLRWFWPIPSWNRPLGKCFSVFIWGQWRVAVQGPVATRKVLESQELEDSWPWTPPVTLLGKTCFGLLQESEREVLRRLIGRSLSHKQVQMYAPQFAQFAQKCLDEITTGQFKKDYHKQERRKQKKAKQQQQKLSKRGQAASNTGYNMGQFDDSSDNGLEMSDVELLFEDDDNTFAAGPAGERIYKVKWQALRSYTFDIVDGPLLNTKLWTATKKPTYRMDGVNTPPLKLQVDGNNNNNNNNNTAVKKNHATKMQPTHKLKPGMVLLEGCDTLEEHYDSIKQRCFAMKDLRSQEGLKAVGLEYRTVFCDEHKPVPEDDNSNDLEDCNDFTNLNAASLRRLTQSSSSLDCNELGNGESAVEDEFPTPTTIASSDDVGSSTAAVDSNDVDALSLSALPPNMLPDGLPNVHLQKEQEEAEDAASIRSTDSIYSENNSSNPLLALQCNNKNDPENQDAEILATALDIRDRCHWCSRRLFYCGNSATRNDANESSTIVEPTLITDENRKRYIADGDMYEQVARLSQEYAQQVMCEEANLQWVTVEDSPERNEPLRFLLSKGHPILQQQGGEEGNQSTNVEQPTLVVCTGRGKVRAGIFSRQHLICGGMELSTAIPMLQEASLRRHHVLVMDPNVHGESLGFVTFQKTLNYYGEQMLLRNSSPSPLYMLSHSASGGHFARYLLDDQPSPQYFLSNLQSVAFTDSTHSVQWAAPPKQKKGQSTTIPWEPHKQALYNFLQSRQCVYFRVGARASRDGVVSSGDWHMHPAGSPAPTDEYWKHRFGTIKTLWAGTNEHSLTNWYPHSQIYGHFDDCLRLLQQQQQQCQETGDTT